MWWEVYTICYKEMMLQKQSDWKLKICRVEIQKSVGLEIQKQSDWKSKICRIEIEKIIGLNYSDGYKYVYRLSLNQ